MEGIAEVLQPAVHVLDLRGQQVAGSEDQVAVEVDVGLLMEEESGYMKGERRY